MHGMIMLTNRRGRKRRFRGSKPGGREVVVLEMNPRTIAASMPHRRDLPEAVRHDQKAVSSLGRMCLFGQIDDDMETAGQTFAGHYLAYLATTEPPRGAIGRNGRGYPCKGDLACDDCECARRKRLYLGALEAIKAVAGKASVDAVFWVAIHDRWCGGGRVAHLRWGLSALIRHYGLTNGKNHGKRN